MSHAGSPPQWAASILEGNQWRTCPYLDEIGRGFRSTVTCPPGLAVHVPLEEVSKEAMTMTSITTTGAAVLMLLGKLLPVQAQHDGQGDKQKEKQDKGAPQQQKR